MARFSSVIVAALAVALPGCSSESSSEPGGSAGSAGSGAGGAAGSSSYEALEAPPEGDGFQISMDVTVDAGVEGTWCKFVALPDQAYEISRYESRFTPISHHLIVYQTLLTEDLLTEQPKGVFDCDEMDRFETLAGMHYGTQSDEDGLEFPPGVGRKTRPTEVALMEYHAINTGKQATLAEARVNFWKAPKPIDIEALVLFFYHPAIAIPPNGEAKARMHCELPESANLVNVLPHMHKRGVSFSATVTGPTGSEETLLAAESYEPETTVFDPPRVIEAGSAIDFECDYQNDGSSTVIEGLSAVKNEMCVFASNYYSTAPLSIATRSCNSEGSYPIFAGTQSCTESEACVTAAEKKQGTAADEDAAVERETCFVDTCEASSKPLIELRRCRVNSCKAECYAADVNTTETQACKDCVTTSCATENDTCAKATCG